MLLSMLAAMAVAHPSTKQIIADSWKSTLVIGHRGAAAYKPENTIPSFQEAILNGASATECDIHLSSDGEMVVMHDKTLDRTTKLKGEVAKTSWETMQRAGIPRLQDLIKATKDKIVLVVEIKSGAGIERKLIDLLNAEKMLDQAIVFSFGEGVIAECERIDPSYFSVWLTSKPGEASDALARIREIGADGIGVSYKALTPELVREAHSRKVPIFAWTVPPGPEVDRLKALKVNFIITDHPRDVIAQLAGR